jgi:hypothetical protein
MKSAVVLCCFLGLLIFNVQRAAGSLANGVDPYNLGQGDWIWEMSSCETALGVATPQAVIDYEANKGMQWVCVKAVDGPYYFTAGGGLSSSSGQSQWTSTIINEAHAKGMKIFAWGYVAGNNSTYDGGDTEAQELALAKWADSVGGDGFIIDAEIQYETNATRVADASLYASGIKSAYPNLFLSYAPFPYISDHTGFPYIQFGTNCDAVMPQDYWGEFEIAPGAMVSDMDGEWSAWQNSLTGFNTNAIKPIIPIGQGYDDSSISYTEKASEITNFVYSLQNDPSPAGKGGYHGVSYWSCQHHTVADWTGLATSIILAGTNSMTVTQGSNATFAVNLPSGGSYYYQWKFNQTSITGATNSSYTVTNAQSVNAGGYSVRVTNNSNCVLNYPAILSVISPLVNSPDSVLAPANMTNWWAAEGNADDIFGTLNGTPNGIYYTNGETGQAFHFDGVTGFLKTGASSLAPPWTVCMWVNRQNAPGTSAALMSDTGANVLKLEQYNGTRQVGISVQGVADYSFGCSVPQNVWTHLAFVDNGSQIQLYTNGVFEGTQLYTNGVAANVSLNFSLPRAYLGVDSFNGVTDAIGSKTHSLFIDFMKGSLDEIQVFHRALSGSEVSAIYNAGSAGLVRAPEFTGIASAGSGQIQLNMRGQTGKNFTLYSSVDLVNWSSLGAISNPTGTVQYMISTGVNPREFYRVTQP